MPRSMTLNVHVHGPLGDFVPGNVGEGGSYENVSEHVCDPSRKGKEHAEREHFERLKAELGVAFAAPDDNYAALTADAIIARNPA